MDRMEMYSWFPNTYGNWTFWFDHRGSLDVIGCERFFFLRSFPKNILLDMLLWISKHQTQHYKLIKLINLVKKGKITTKTWALRLLPWPGIRAQTFAMLGPGFFFFFFLHPRGVRWAKIKTKPGLDALRNTKCQSAQQNSARWRKECPFQRHIIALEKKEIAPPLASHWKKKV